MLSCWWGFRHWHWYWRWMLPFWQVPVQPVMNISYIWRYFRFSEEKLPKWTSLSILFPIWVIRNALHYCDVIMGGLASQITSITIVYSSVHSGADQRKYQSSASLAFVRWIHRWAVNSSHKWPVTRKMFPFDDVIMWFTSYPPGGAGEGAQHLTPEGTQNNTQEVKSDETLPFYCHPPNPCPKGFTGNIL